MSADKRTVATDALETLGTVIGPGEKRDAIHLAVDPAVAAHTLLPGQDVGFDVEGKASRYAVAMVGIVDPFLKGPVAEGERFWLVVYPRQITSLRHVWEHPAFPSSGETDGAAPKPFVDKRKVFAESWLRQEAARLDVGFNELIDHARDYADSRKRGGFGDYWVEGGKFEGEYISTDFWRYWSEYTGEDGTDKDGEDLGNFLSCSC